MTDEPLVANPAGQPITHRYATNRIRKLRESLIGNLGASLLPGHVRRGLRNWLLRTLMKSPSASKRKADFMKGVSPLTPEARRDLLDRLDAPTRELELFLGRELPAWHQ